MPLTDLPIRVMTAADAPHAATLAAKVGWSHTSETWDRCIRWSGSGSFCIVDGDELVATTTVLTYSQELAWIGMVITHPDYQRRGLARRLMQKALADLQDCGIKRVMLDASQLGYPLYADLGFRPLYKIEVLSGQAVELSSDSIIRDVTPADIDGVVRLDGRLFSLPRPQLIGELAAPGTCWVDGEPGNLQGYVMVSPNRLGFSIGPWYHQTPDGAETLLRRALMAVNGQDVRVNVPEINSNARSIALRCGLTSNRFVTRMILGSDPPGDMGRQYGVASFATG
jgi:GNAT superfamily N-acetyltransferase